MLGAAAATGTALLDWRTLDGAVRAVHAAISRQGLEHGMASGALIEPLARIGRHGFGGTRATLGASNDRL